MSCCTSGAPFQCRICGSLHGDSALALHQPGIAARAAAGRIGYVGSCRHNWIACQRFPVPAFSLGPTLPRPTAGRLVVEGDDVLEDVNNPQDQRNAGH